MLQANCFGGACMAVFVTLPIVSEPLLAQMIRFRKAMEAYPHVTVCFLPPPPIRTVHYGEVAVYLLKEGGELYRIAPDVGSTLQVGRYSTVVVRTDKGYVSNGVWTREGWQLVKMHIIHAAGWLCFQERRRNASSAPLRQKGKLELSGQKEPKDRVRSTLSGRITEPATAKPSQSALTDLLSSILTHAAKNASTSRSSAPVTVPQRQVVP